MKKRILCLILAVALIMNLAACGKKGIDKISQSISTYDIEMSLNDANKTAECFQTVDYINSFDAELNKVCFNLYPNAFSSDAKIKPVDAEDIARAYPTGMSYGNIEIKNVKASGKAVEFKIEGCDNNILTVPLQKSLMPGDRVKIEIQFNLKLAAVNHRLGYNEKTVNLGNFYPVAAMYEGGDFVDHPYYAKGDPFYSQMANYNVKITAPKAYVAAMSGESVRTEQGDYATTSSSAKALRDFAIVLGEFEALSGLVGTVNVTYYYYNDDQPENRLNAAMDSIKTFSNMFGAYPYKTLSVVQTKFLQGGMEYPGLVYVSDVVMGELYNEVIIHETAHQWWYGVVGSNQVETPWLDETMAEYSTTLFYEANTSYNVKYADRISDALSGYIMYCDMYEASLDTRMDKSLKEFASQTEYTFMTYVKGQILMDTVRRTVGDRAFFEGVKNYYSTSSFTIARPEHLIGALEKSAKTQLKELFDSFTSGKVHLYGN